MNRKVRTLRARKRPLFVVIWLSLLLSNWIISKTPTINNIVNGWKNTIRNIEKRTRITNGAGAVDHWNLRSKNTIKGRNRKDWALGVNDTWVQPKIIIEAKAAVNNTVLFSNSWSANKSVKKIKKIEETTGTRKVMLIMLMLENNETATPNTWSAGYTS